MAAPGLIAAALLAVAGAAKVVDPAATVGALRALRLPSSPGLVRAGAAGELFLAVGAIAVGGPLAWALVAASYLAFTAFVLAALRHGTMVGSCGCFGREDTPPHLTHVVLNVALAAVAAGLAITAAGPAVDGFSAEPARSATVVGLATVGLYMLHALYVDLPRTLVHTPGPSERP